MEQGQPGQLRWGVCVTVGDMCSALGLSLMLPDLHV